MAGGAADQARDGYPGTWPTLDAYFEEIERQGIAGNFATWVPQGVVRASVLGYAMRPATPDEQQRMGRLVREAMEAGAFGVSTGLIYAPSGYADTDEIATLAAEVRHFGGLYASHLRNEGAGLLSAVDEAIEIGQRAGVPVQVAHHKAAGKDNWGLVHESLARMDRARAEGVDVACDQYPYTASSTGLTSMMPKWALEGGRVALLERLREPSMRARIQEEMLALRPDLGSLATESHWHNVLISRARNTQAAQGQRLSELAQAQARDPFDVYFGLLEANDGNVSAVFFSMCEADVHTILRWPHTMIGSDASSVAPYGSLSEGRPHPRAYGTFPRVLGRYARDLRVLTWEEAVRKMTGLPAKRMGLCDRGVLRRGAWADVVVLDPDAVVDRATFQDPHQYAEGIEQVLVNGVTVVRDGEHTGALPGRILKRCAS